MVYFLVCDPDAADVFADAVDAAQGGALRLVSVSLLCFNRSALCAHRVGDETIRGGADVIHRQRIAQPHVSDLVLSHPSGVCIATRARMRAK
jgi:hypothetical protein